MDYEVKEVPPIIRPHARRRNPARMMFGIRSPLSKTWKIGISIASLVILLGCYEALSYRQHLINPNDTTIPSFVQMGQAFIKVCTPDSAKKVWLYEDLKATVFRHLLGLSLGVVASVILGMAMGCFKPIESFFIFILSFFTRVPPTAMLAVFFVLVGTDYKMFLTMIGFGILPTLTQAICQSAKYDVHEELIYKGYTGGGSTMEVIIEVIFREILPRIIDAVRLQVGPAMVFLIAAEWMMADIGFGYRLRIQSRLLNLAVVYDYIIILGLYGLALDYGLLFLREYLCHWFSLKHKEKENG